MHVYNITRKYTIDQFDKDLINAVVYNLFLKNECATFKKNENKKKSSYCFI